MKYRTILPIVLLLSTGCGLTGGVVGSLIAGGVGLVTGGVAGYKARDVLDPKSGAPPPEIKLVETVAPEGADLVATMQQEAAKMDAAGARPRSPQTAFFKEAADALVPIVGPGTPLPKATPEAARIEAAKIRDGKAERIDRLEQLKGQVGQLTSDRRRTTWIALGATALTALAGVVALWLKLGQKVGVIAGIAWALIFSALGVGALARLDGPVVWIAAGVLVAVAVVVVAVLRLLKADVLAWIGFGQRSVVAVQEARARLKPETRAEVDAALKNAQSRELRATVANVKADLNLTTAKGHT